MCLICRSRLFYLQSFVISVSVGGITDRAETSGCTVCNPLLLSLAVRQICGVTFRCVGCGELSAVLCSGRSVDAQRSAGGHAGYRGYGAAEA